MAFLQVFGLLEEAILDLFGGMLG
ncbi:uncharacterized protein G2W53_015354 [Senna tora]|uniref:Uncharacterized protein n=1 Tax=Senna tora TaxID=362788 RepID=A0A835C4L0_9FABA|nr:uncharacterized protein G2W53_015354 [Senna tora]